MKNSLRFNYFIASSYMNSKFNVKKNNLIIYNSMKKKFYVIKKLNFNFYPTYGSDNWSFFVTSLIRLSIFELFLIINLTNCPNQKAFGSGCNRINFSPIPTGK